MGSPSGCSWEGSGWGCCAGATPLPFAAVAPGSLPAALSFFFFFLLAGAVLAPSASFSLGATPISASIAFSSSSSFFFCSCNSFHSDLALFELFEQHSKHKPCTGPACEKSSGLTFLESCFCCSVFAFLLASSSALVVAGSSSSECSSATKLPAISMWTLAHVAHDWNQSARSCHNLAIMVSVPSCSSSSSSSSFPSSMPSACSIAC